jgi:putative transposase
MAFVEPASDVDWRLAMEREFVIRPLAAEAKLTSEQVEEAMLRLSLGRSVLYKLVHRYKQRPQTSSLLPWKRGRAYDVRFRLRCKVCTWTVRSWDF